MLEHGALSWEITRQKTGTIDPDSNGISIWNAWLLAIVLYDSWVVPMLLCFNVINPDICHETWLTNALMSFEIFFAIDIYVQLHTGYYVAGDLVRNSTSTQRRYIHSYQFPLDLLALIPLSFFSFASDQACGVILVNKLLRLRRIPAYTLEFDKVFALYFKFCKSIKMVVVSFFFCHYIACFYVIFGKAHGDGDEDDVWKIHDESEHGHHRLLTEYFAALFWSSGLVSKCLEGEIPRTLLQTLFMLVVMLGGFLLFVYICGTLFMISKCDTNSVEKFDAKINQLRYILSFHRIPQDVQERAVEFLENGFNSGDTNDRNTMKLLCPSIAKDVKFTLLKSMVSNIPFFRCCDAAFTRALIDLMETQSLPTNYVVCSKGEQGEEMYFVQSGVLAVLINDIKVRELRKGGFFGELSLFTNQVRTANVVTATFCILHKLSRSHVRRVLRAYPHFEAQIMACVTALLEEMDMQNADTAKKNSLKMDAVNKRAKAYGAFVGQDNKGVSSSSQDKLKGGPASMKDKSVDEPSVKNFITWKKFLLRTAINRKSRFRLAWLVGIMIATLYNVFTVPLLNTFQLIDYPISILLLNTLADVVLWLDMYGKFNLSFVLDAEQIMDPPLCAQNYLRASFYFDFICAFPWWILYPSQHLKLRFIRLLRFYNIGEDFEELALFVRINSRRRLFLLGLGLFLCYHIAGCMAHSLALVVGYDANGHGWLPPKTLQLQKVVDNSTGDLLGYNYMDGVRFVPLGDPLVGEIILTQYTRALQYGAVCLTNLGRTLEPENLWEFILAFVLMLSGMLLISLIIDDVQKCVTASAIEQMEFLSTRSRILHFLHKQKASLNMHQRVSAYLDFWWSAHRGANINSLLGELPHSMQHEIYTFMFSPMLDIVQRMDHISDKFETVSKLLLDKLIIHLYGQGEIIYRFGDYADSLYILVVGQCAIGRHIRASDTLPARDLKPGDFFGCSSLHLDCEDIVHNDQAFARSACVIAMISRTTLALINQAFPSFCENALRREQKRSGEHRAMSKLLNPTELSSLSKTTKVVVINPDSKFSVFWETILFIGMVYQSIGVPYYMAFGFTVQDVGPSDSISFVLEFCFLIDIALKTRTGYFSYGNKVMDISKIRKRYFRSLGFIIDVLAVLPINLVNAFLEKRSEAWNMNKLLRLFKLSSQIEHLERHYYSINIQIRVFKLVFYICLLSHYIGCTWYNFGSNASTIFGFIQDSQFGHDPWLPGAELDLRNHELSTFSKYRRALYWGLGLLLGFEPGQYPETPIEYLFTAVVQTLGVFLLAYVVGNLLDIVQVTEGNNRLFYSNLNYVRKLTSYFEFTEDMKSKIQHYYFYRLFHSIHEEHNGDNLQAVSSRFASYVSFSRSLSRNPWLKKITDQILNVEVQSNFYRNYLKTMCCCQLYIALSVPYFVTFGHGGKASVTTIIFSAMDFTTDIVFAYDILFKSQLKETVASREFYEHRLQHNKLGVIADNSTLLRFNRFIKLRQFTSAINEVNLFSMSYEVNRLKLLALYYFIVCYWTACGYFGLTFIEGFASEWNSSLPVEYFNPANHGDNSDVVFSIHQLLRCLYYSGTMYTGIGLVYEPEDMLEFAFTFIISIFGVFVMGYVIGEGSTLCIYLIQNEVEFKINQMNIMEFLARKRMDRSLHSRVWRINQYWSNYLLEYALKHVYKLRD
ncbi:hypothetical protein AeRB84_000053 [Aphanomyces euteiches]|nr:hypothetical protein AeRB84_000053 [Aphanomyces euteiches]